MRRGGRREQLRTRAAQHKLGGYRAASSHPTSHGSRAASSGLRPADGGWRRRCGLAAPRRGGLCPKVAVARARKRRLVAEAHRHETAITFLFPGSFLSISHRHETAIAFLRWREIERARRPENTAADSRMDVTPLPLAEAQPHSRPPLPVPPWAPPPAASGSPVYWGSRSDLIVSDLLPFLTPIHYVGC